MAQILVVDDEQSFRQVMRFKLQEMGYSVQLAENGVVGYERFTELRPDLVITDLTMPEMDGLELTRRISAASNETPVVVLTAFGDIQSAVSAMKLGAIDYLTKPVDWEKLHLSIENGLRLTKLINENRRLKALVSERYHFSRLIGVSQRMQQLYQTLERIAATEVTVLILGESGTGKELVARAIHLNGARRDNPFVTVNCAAIPENLLESELFGHRRGAFTGATYDRKGLFEEAHTGTLFLDEIGELPLQLQAKLLRVLQEGEFMRLGDNTTRRADVRVIAATNRNLLKMVEDGSFREDLYFRLNIVPLKLPALRERREDIPLLAEHFLREIARKYNRSQLRLSNEALRAFNRYSWPGNVRELRNTIERLAILVEGNVITQEDLPEEFAFQSADSLPIRLPDEGLDLEEVEKEIIRQALERHDWNQTHTARYLNITRNTLIYRMQKFGLAQKD